MLNNLKAGRWNNVFSVALAAGWLVSTVARPIPGLGRVGIGFTAACLLGAVGAIGTLALQRHAFNKHLKSVLVVWCALGAGPTLSWAITSLDLPGLVFVVRWWLLLGFFVSIRTANTEFPTQLFAWTGAAFLGAHLLLLVAGSFASTAFGWAWEIGTHQHLGNTRRFIGWVGNPAALGTSAFLAASMGSRSQMKWVAWASPVAGALIAVFTLSVATLAVPAFLLVASFRSVRWRVMSAGAGVVAAMMILYIKPLTVGLGDRRFEVSEVHPAYHRHGNGPRFMPQRELSLGAATFQFHFTAYAYLAVAGLKCFAENPVFGVGLERFVTNCTHMTMSTYGGWSLRRRAHNQFVQWVSETGGVGLLLAVLALLFARKKLPWMVLGRWQWGTLAAIMVTSLGGEMLATIPLSGWSATQMGDAGGGGLLKLDGDLPRLPA